MIQLGGGGSQLSGRQGTIGWKERKDGSHLMEGPWRKWKTLNSQLKWEQMALIFVNCHFWSVSISSLFLTRRPTPITSDGNLFFWNGKLFLINCPLMVISSFSLSSTASVHQCSEHEKEWEWREDLALPRDYSLNCVFQLHYWVTVLGLPSSFVMLFPFSSHLVQCLSEQKDV